MLKLTAFSSNMWAMHERCKFSIYLSKYLRQYWAALSKFWKLWQKLRFWLCHMKALAALSQRWYTAFEFTFRKSIVVRFENNNTKCDCHIVQNAKWWPNYSNEFCVSIRWHGFVYCKIIHHHCFMCGAVGRTWRIAKL